MIISNHRPVDKINSYNNCQYQIMNKTMSLLLLHQKEKLKLKVKMKPVPKPSYPLQTQVLTGQLMPEKKLNWMEPKAMLEMEQ